MEDEVRRRFDRRCTAGVRVQRLATLLIAAMQLLESQLPHVAR